MVLKKQFILTLFCIIYTLSSFGQNKAIYADKYDVNYYISSVEQNTKLYFATDLFQFLELEQLYLCGAYIDSFLTNEKVSFDQNFGFINQNTFVIELDQSDIQKCRLVTSAWNENFKINFQEFLFKLVNNIDYDSLALTSNSLIYKKLIDGELSRFYNQGNTVNVVSISFLIPEKLTENDFKLVFTHYNTKRFTTRDSDLIISEILFNNNVPIGNIKFSFPAMGRHTFLKNCIAMTMLEIAYKDDLKFNMDYGINQVIASFEVANSLKETDSLNYHFEKKQFSDAQFESLKLQAIENIKKIAKSNLFYYSYYDIEKLKTLSEKFTIKEYYNQVDILNLKRNFTIEINESSTILYKGKKLTSTNLSLFDKSILFKNNSIEFLNESDTILINKLCVLMLINSNYSLAINGIAKGSEFLFVEKDKKELLLNKYESYGFSASRRKKLALFRALNIFNTLNDFGISYYKMQCTGTTARSSVVDFNLYIND